MGLALVLEERGDPGRDGCCPGTFQWLPWTSGCPVGRRPGEAKVRSGRLAKGLTYVCLTFVHSFVHSSIHSFIQQWCPEPQPYAEHGTGRDQALGRGCPSPALGPEAGNLLVLPHPWVRWRPWP